MQLICFEHNGTRGLEKRGASLIRTLPEKLEETRAGSPCKNTEKKSSSRHCKSPARRARELRKSSSVSDGWISLHMARL